MDLLTMAALVVGGSAVLYVLRLITHARSRRWVPPKASPTSEVEGGRVATIEGRVRATGETLRAPLTNRPCVAYRASAMLRSRQRVGAPSTWTGEQELVESHSAPFHLVDETGEAIVEAASARIVVPADRVEVAHDIDGPTGRVREWLTSRGAVPHEADLFEEAIVQDGDVVVVQGRAVRSPAETLASGAVSYRSPAAQRHLRIIEDPQHPDSPVVIGKRR